MDDFDYAALCHQLDDACPNYEFFWTGGAVDRAICIYKRGHVRAEDRITKINFPDDDREYVITKIILEYAGGTPVASIVSGRI